MNGRSASSCYILAESYCPALYGTAGLRICNLNSDLQHPLSFVPCLSLWPLSKFHNILQDFFCGHQQQCRDNSFLVRNTLLNLITVSFCIQGACVRRAFLLINAGPAVKVPGLVFCAGQTATGEIKQATVRLSGPGRIYYFIHWLILISFTTENRFTES
jgi:hypothetical protein